MQLFQIDVDRLRPNPRNPRGTDYENWELGELAGSLKRVGMQQPIVAFPDSGGGGPVIQDGERRWRAAKLAGIGKVPVLIVPETDIDVQIGRMCAAAMHKRIPPVKLGRSFAELRDRFGLTIPQIAERTGYSQKTVQDRLFLTTLPVEVQDMVERKELTASEGASIARERDEKKKAGRPVGKTLTWFNRTHRLASQARARCADSDHPQRVTRIGGVACGECWEHVIRQDALASVPLAG